MSWEVLEVEDSVAALHQLPLEPVRRITICTPTDRAMVLGAGQSESILDLVALQNRGATWCRRRSGGGAVWVTPTNQLWLSVTIPREDPLWTEDVTRAAMWLGERLAAAIEGPERRGGCAEVHQGSLSVDPLGRVVCLASRGPGEVFVDGRKLVAISVKRGLSAAAFHVSLVQEPDTDAYVDFLRLADKGERADVAQILARRIGSFAMEGREPAELRRLAVEAIASR